MSADKETKETPAAHAGKAEAGPAPIRREHFLFGAVGLVVGIVIGYVLAYEVHVPSRHGYEPQARPAAMPAGPGMGNLAKGGGNDAHAGLPPEVRQQMEQARAVLVQHKKMLEEDPDNVDLILTIGRFYLNLGDAHQGLEYFGRAVELQPENVAVLIETGHAQSDVGRYEDALATYEAAAKIEPGNADVQSHTGLVLLRTGKVDEALEALDRAAALDPKHAMSRFNKAVVLLYSKKDADAAEKALEEAAAVVPPGFDGLDAIRKAIQQFRETGSLPEMPG